MARLVTKFKYLKPKREKKAGGYARYIATREGVDKLDDTQRLSTSTINQKTLIEKILRDFPDSKEMLEYEDYQKQKTVGTASEFISRALEDNAYEVMNSKTYADYIATRPRAERFGTHGLFTDDSVQVQLSKVSEELNLHGGNVWTAIISLRREDAERLGFNTGERWRDMLRTQTQAISDNLKIPMENLKWFAAFHNESHHPHVHLIAYSTIENEGYLTKKGIANLRSFFAKDIFAQDLLCVYEKQKDQRDKLRLHSREFIAGIVSQINSGIYDNPKLEELLLQLAGRLGKTSGKKIYGYLKADVKAVIDAIVDELSCDERISTLYDLWYEQKEKILRIYTQEMPQRIPLSQNKEFKSIRNAVIQQALNIAADRIMDDGNDINMPEPELPEEEIYEPSPGNEPTEVDDKIQTPSGSSRGKKKTWWTEEYKQARIYLYGKKDVLPNPEKALALMKAEAGQGNGFAMHDLGKMFLSGLGCSKDEETAQEWLGKAYDAFIREVQTVKNPGYLQYRIGKLFSFGYGVDQDYAKAAGWYEKAVAENNPFAAYALGSLYRRGQGVEQNDEKAFTLFTMSAEDKEKPNAYAQYELGGMCLKGIGTTVDKTASDDWYRLAYNGFLVIEQSMADDKLYYRLGQMNLHGIGTDINLNAALSYFEKAAKVDNLDAMYGLSKLYLRKNFENHNPQKAVQYLIAAAQKGHDYAQYTLGRLFLMGEDVAKNPDYALRWLEEAVKQENPSAEYLLGKILLHGEDVGQDTGRAVILLEKSVVRGNEYAAYTLGKAYLDGELLSQDMGKALNLLTMSADKGFSAAQYSLGKLFYSGEAVPQDIPKSLSYLKRAAEQENSYAAYLIGKILLTEELYKDIPQAFRYFMLAAKKGNSYAEYMLGKLYLYGKDIEQDLEEAIRWLTTSAEHGNQYAAQLLHSIRNNRSWSAAMGSLRLLQHLSKILQERLTDEHKDKIGSIDRKLKRQIDEKKQAHGLRQ